MIMLLERMALDVAQQDLLHVAVEVQGQDRRVEPLVLAACQTGSVFELDALTGSRWPPYTMAGILPA
jgi:hypothetical protein